ncbi:MAG: hypothetical protein MRERC_1c077 [Mycoplasmataceae bacterium RC_NB112A]|nr:MAG: hypothetical protein MRERC_1c077 [Mycoplasmataceae bacterium RC_NB112A]
MISVLRKIGTVVAFLLPLLIWIYSLIRFLGSKGESEQLETETKATN